MPMCLEEAPQDHEQKKKNAFGDTLQIITVSGRKRVFKEENVSRLAEWITGQHKLLILVIPKTSSGSIFLPEGLSASDANGEGAFSSFRRNVKQISGSPKTFPVFLFFPGEGAQCIEMTSIYTSHSRFQKIYDECFALFDADLKMKAISCYRQSSRWITL